MIDELYSDEPSVRAEAMKKLLSAARESPQVRSQVVQAAIGILENPRPGKAATWYVTAELLGELKATEAIPVLVKQLDYNDGTIGLSMSHSPAVRALVQIGRPAVPLLVKVLSDARPSIRQNAALALGQIGGNAAATALRRALKTETNKEVRFYIESGLSNLGSK